MPQFDNTLINTRVAALHKKEEEALIQSLAPKYGLQYINLHGITINPDALHILSESESRKGELVIFENDHAHISVAVRNPESPLTKQILAEIDTGGREIHQYMASLQSIEHGWERYGDGTHAVAEKKGILAINQIAIEKFAKEIKTHLDVATKILEIRTSDTPERVTNTMEVIFGGALALNVSDIHIEPAERMARVRYRIDGVLWDIVDIERTIYKLINSRIKLLSGLKLNVHDEAQDGRFTFNTGTRALEIRTSLIPGANDESIVMRLLDPDASSFKLKNLGFNKRLLEVVMEELQRPNGAIITTGPTGSGKTTALYAFMQEIHTPEIKIITIEDPIEYKLPGIVQTQVSDEYTFASGLRSILRQDPDVIMVGEIRDRDVAETATHAALTGHLVFSTLHTNSAVGAFPRLIDLGVDSRMIGSAFNLILGQRLVRKLCEHCRHTRDTTTEEQKIIALIMSEPVSTHVIYESPGCDACGHSGFKGRIGIYEAIRVDKAVEEAVIADPRENNIRKAAAPQKIPTMQQDGITKVLEGVTSFDELERVIDLHNTRIELTSVENTGVNSSTDPA